MRGLRSLGPEEQAAAVVTVKRSLADSRAVSMSTQSVVVAEAVSKRSKKEQDRRLQGGAAGSPTLGMQNVGGGDKTKEGRAEAGGDRVEAVGPGTGAEAAVGQGTMSGGLEEEVGGDDTVEESGAEGESCDLEAAVQRHKVQEATGWDFTVQVRNMHRQWERQGWAGWKAGQTGRYWAQGHEGPLWDKEWMEWLKGDEVAWERKQLAREDRFCAQGHKGGDADGVAAGSGSA